MHLGRVRYFLILLLIAALCQQSLQISTSPLKFKYGTKEYYVELYLKANWFLANQFCKFHGMELLTLDNPAEVTKLRNTLIDSGIDERFWTGGNDLAKLGSWSWASNGNWNPIYTNWKPGEPNNLAGNEHCVVLYGASVDYQWNDSPCSTEFYFICQSDKSNDYIK